MLGAWAALLKVGGAHFEGVEIGGHGGCSERPLLVPLRWDLLQIKEGCELEAGF